MKKKCKKKAKNRRSRLKPQVLCFPRASVATSVLFSDGGRRRAPAKITGLDIDTASCKGSLRLGEEKRERLFTSAHPFVNLGRHATPQLALRSADTFDRLIRRRAGRLRSHIKASQGCLRLDGPTLPSALRMLLGHRLLPDYFCRPGILT